MDALSISESIFSSTASPLGSPTLSHPAISSPAPPSRHKTEFNTTEYNIKRNSIFVDKANAHLSQYGGDSSPAKRSSIVSGRYSFFLPRHSRVPDSPSRPENVLKVKIYTKDNVLAVKLRKDKLNNVKELIQVVCMKIDHRPKDLLLTFKDKQLSSMSLMEEYFSDLIMDYIALKDKIYVCVV